MSVEGGTSRRTVLLGAGAVCALGLLGACGIEPAPGPSSPGTSPGGMAPSTTGPQGIPIRDVPVGGGLIVGALVITQPTEGEFHAFSRSCPHEGNPVTLVSGGLITCESHGSQFRIADGGVVTGPATRGLTARTVTVSGDVLVIT